MPGKLSDEEKKALENDAKAEQSAQEEVRKKEEALKHVDARIESVQKKQDEMHEGAIKVSEQAQRGERSWDSAKIAKKDFDEKYAHYVEEEKSLMREREAKARELEQAKQKAEKASRQYKEKEDNR